MHHNNLFHSIFEMYLASGFRRIVQIGANDGRINDPIYESVMKNSHNNQILLIEPQSNVIPELEKNYKNHPNVKILNCAIGNNSILKMYRLKPELYECFQRRYLKNSPSYRVPSGFTSSSRAHVVKHTIGNIPPALSVDEAIEDFDVDCMSLLEALRTVKWLDDDIDVLQIDAEGGDHEVLLSCNLEITKPALINFEHKHLSENAYHKLILWLQKKGYQTYKYSNSDAMAYRLTY